MWRIVPGQSLACREWDDEVVLFNDLSGNTHLLDGVALDLLHALRAGPRAAAALAAQLDIGPDPDTAAAGAQDEADDEPEDVTALVETMLASLARLDLVEPC